VGAKLFDLLVVAGAWSASPPESLKLMPYGPHAMLFLGPIIVSILLAAVAAGDLIFLSHDEWPSHERMLAKSSLILLFGSDALAVALSSGHAAPNYNPVPAALATLLAAVVSFFLALFTSGRFRWLASSAAAVIIAWIGQLAFMISGLSGLR
jgi:hypothetical protein